jgi:hypothetical protein
LSEVNFTTIAAQLGSKLAESQNRDGGWGYYPGKLSRVEPTAWAILGLTAHSGQLGTLSRDRALQWLKDKQQTDGSYWSAPQAGDSLWTTAPALLALAGAGRSEDAQAREKSLQSLLRQKARTTRDTSGMRSDVESWGWMTDCFSWVEPTCYSILALRAAATLQNTTNPLLEKRVAEGETILWARRCPDGGWNYGNGRSQGYALWAFPVPTALVLVTLRRSAEGQPMEEAWNRLEVLRAKESSLLSLSWGALAGKALGKDVDSWLAQLSAVLHTFPQHTNSDRGLALLATGKLPPIFQS